MKNAQFDPKAGSLELSFTNGNTYSLDLRKTYHREEGFYVDLFWEETKASISLSLALHPKEENLTLESCYLKWPLSNSATEIRRQGFTHPVETTWSNRTQVSKAPGFWRKLAEKKVNSYDPLPHPSSKKASYQAISIRTGKQGYQIKSTDESAALTVFSLPQNEHSLVAENQCQGYQLRHTFPAFELAFNTLGAQQRAPTIDRFFSLAVTPHLLQEETFEALTLSSLLDEGGINSIVLKQHGYSSPSNSSFDASLFQAFAKTCLTSSVQPGIELSPFVVSDTSTGVKTVTDSAFRRWSPSLEKWVYPLDLSDDDTMRTCEQHLLRYYQIGYRFFILQDIALSLKDGLKTTTTGQQLNRRLELIRRVLPGVTIILGDLCSNELCHGFHGFKKDEVLRTQLPRIARFAGFGKVAPAYGKLSPYRIQRIDFDAETTAKESHSILDLSKESFGLKTLLAIESTIGSDSYPSKVMA